MRTFPWIAVVFTLSVACGGAGPGQAGAPAATSTPAPTAPSAPAAGTPSTPASPASGASSCNTTLNVVNDRTDFDEVCGSTSRQCTLEAGASAWSCLCTAASGSVASCQAQVAQPGVVTPPPDCCPAG